MCYYHRDAIFQDIGNADKEAEKEAEKEISSIVPSERSFDTELFLTLVHGNVSMTDLKVG